MYVSSLAAAAAAPRRAPPRNTHGIWFMVGSIIPASMISWMWLTLKLLTPMERARPELKMDTTPRHVLKRHAFSSYAAVPGTHAGSEDGVLVLWLTLPWLALCHGQCTSSASTYVVFMSDRIFSNCAIESLNPSGLLGPTLDSRNISARGTPEDAMPMPTSTSSW